jgi:hypothetical protein
LLKPRTVDPQVGRRPIDALDPGPTPAIPELGGILRLGGALRAPLVTLSDDDLAEYWRFEKWARRTARVPGRDGRVVNLAADYAEQTPADANAGSGVPQLVGKHDPLIVPPLYGRWARGVAARPARADPACGTGSRSSNSIRHRRCGLGTGGAALPGGVHGGSLAAGREGAPGNARIRFAHMAMLTSIVRHRRDVGYWRGRGRPSPAFTAPVHRRVLAGGKTIGYTMRSNLLPPTLLATTVRKPCGRARGARLGGFTAARATTGLIARVNAGEISAAPPKMVPANLPTGPAIAARWVAGRLVWCATRLAALPCSVCRAGWWL